MAVHVMKITPLLPSDPPEKSAPYVYTKPDGSMGIDYGKLLSFTRARLPGGIEIVDEQIGGITYFTLKGYLMISDWLGENGYYGEVSARRPAVEFTVSENLNRFVAEILALLSVEYIKSKVLSVPQGTWREGHDAGKIPEVSEFPT